MTNYCKHKKYWINFLKMADNDYCYNSINDKKISKGLYIGNLLKDKFNAIMHRQNNQTKIVFNSEEDYLRFYLHMGNLLNVDY
jgi:hypothetical protein